jgi:NAD(P)-dependent dehydrogenase (short-subunit alcohol dehydrogenase family)
MNGGHGMSLEGRTVVVIGGSSGIGYAIAKLAATQGATLLIAGRDNAKLDDAARRLGVARTAAFDAHDEEALTAFLDALDELDHLVSTIGDSMSGGFMTTTTDTMRHVIASKFWTNWTIGRLGAQKIRKRGSITFTAGTGGRPHEISASYVANLGITALVQGLAVELAPDIRVNAVAPTFMDTPFWRDLSREQFESTRAGFVDNVPLNRLGTVEEVASSYIHLMTSSFITGQTLPVDGGVSINT